MKIFISLLLLGFSFASYSHEEVESDTFNLDRTMELFRQAMELTPEILNPTSPVATPVLKVGSERIHLNSAFWNLTRGYIQLYHSEIARDCSECELDDPEILLEEAKDLAAKGFFHTKLLDPLGHSVEHIVIETADLGARLGGPALVAKIASEVAETVGSKFVGGAGVHVFCNAIDAVIIFGTRHIQTLYRVPAWSRRMGASSVTSSFRYFAASRAIKRAQKRVQFQIEPFEVNDEELAIIDSEGPDRWWGYVRKGKRGQWISMLEKKSKKGQLSLKHTQLSSKQFFGQRYKRFFYLKGRKRGSSLFLKGATPMDQALNKNLIWIGAVQENILNRAMIPSSPEEQTELIKDLEKLERDRKGLKQSSVIKGLALENKELWPEEFLESLLVEIGEIFDPKVSSSQRYMKVLMIENLLGGVLYQMMKWKVHDQSVESEGYFGKLWELAHMRWTMGKYVNYVYQYGDFLRVSASSKNEYFLAEAKYQAMENFIRVFKHLKMASDILDQNLSARKSSEKFQVINERLNTFKPWREKRSSYSWIPFLKPLPKCQSLAQLVEH